MDHRCELHRITVPGDMHIKGFRIRMEQVIMHRCDLETALDHFRHHGTDLGLEQYEIAHNHGSALHRLERKPAAERQRRLDGDVVQRHREIAARKSVAADVS